MLVWDIAAVLREFKSQELEMDRRIGPKPQ
jgi:hypothetical protein